MSTREKREKPPQRKTQAHASGKDTTNGTKSMRDKRKAMQAKSSKYTHLAPPGGRGKTPHPLLHRNHGIRSQSKPRWTRTLPSDKSVGLARQARDAISRAKPPLIRICRRETIAGHLLLPPPVGQADGEVAPRHRPSRALGDTWSGHLYVKCNTPA